MISDKTTNHAQARFFSRYGREISDEELRHIQNMLRNELDDTQYIGRVKRGEEDSYLSCYHGTYDGIEFFALCDPETLVIVTFIREDQIRNFEEFEF